MTDEFLRFLSTFCGWLYFIAWSVSFYPQGILNFKRKTTQGVQPDFWLLNVIGFTCYTVSTAAFLFSPVIKQEYAARHPLSPRPTVRINDLVFGAHALLFCIITYSQFYPWIWGWKTDRAKQRSNAISRGLITGSAIALVVLSLVVVHDSIREVEEGRAVWQWIDVVYAISFVKLLLTVFKYVPQVVHNYRRKSTLGWSSVQQLLDFAGSILSFVQLFIDSSLQGDWSGLTGNPMKLGLSNISLLFDVIFIVQHYVLYGPVETDDIGGPNDEDSVLSQRAERDPLLNR